MNRSKGIHANDIFKLGKAPAKKDSRNLKLAVLLRALPPVPENWDFDAAHSTPPVPVPMFGNDSYGDCVIAGRAHGAATTSIYRAIPPGGLCA